MMFDWDEIIEMECVMPGSVFGTVDVVCDQCGEITTHEANQDGNNSYQCPDCGSFTEV
jgi:formylmethanofuran dehydrogenase subunit E